MKGIYIVLLQYRLSDHYVTPDKNATERCEFVNKITNRHITDATVILDFKNKTVYKSRNPDLAYQDYYDYIKTRFENEISHLEKEYGEENAENVVS